MSKSTKLAHIKKLLHGSGGLALLLVILIAVNYILSAPGFRLRADLTAENLHTLSDATRKVLSDLKRPVRMRFFFSRSNPAIGSQHRQIAKQLEDLILAYVDASGGQVNFSKYDPTPFSEAESLAMNYGVRPILEHPEIPPVYFELLITSGTAEPERVTILAAVTKGRLEYEITQAINRLTRASLPTIGVMSSLPVLGEEMPMQAMMMQPPPQDMPQRWALFDEFSEDYHFVEVPLDSTDISVDKFATLFLIHPKAMTSETLYALDQYVLSGGQLAVFVDPYCTSDQPPSPQGMPIPGQTVSSDLPILLKHWGVNYSADHIVVDHVAAWQRADMERGAYVQEPRILILPNDFLNGENELTRQLRVLVMLFSGALSVEEREGITATPLIATSRQSRMIAREQAELPLTQELTRAMQPDGVSRILALQLAGSFSTAFPKGAPASADPAEAQPDPPSDSHLETGEGVVLVFADVDMLSDQCSFDTRRDPRTGRNVREPVSSNPNLIAGVLEQMASGTDLFMLRTKGSYSRPFTRIIAMRRKLEADKLKETQRLEATASEIETALNNLIAQRSRQGGMISSAELESSIKRYQEERQEVQRKRWAIDKTYADSISALQMRIKLLNIGLLPLLIGLTGIFVGIRRSHKL